MSPTAGRRPRFSVVIPFYNVERFLPKCLEGLRAQSFPRDEFEIILVDNRSTDSSATIAATYEDAILLHQPESGSYAARNMGIREARGEIIATIDPDCCPDPDWLEQIDCAMQDGKVSILLGHQRHGKVSKALRLLEMYEAEKVAYVTGRQERELYFGYTSNMAFRRELFDAIGLFPERVRGGDTIFVRRAVDAFGCDVVQYNPRMNTTHLELDSLGAYYNKRLIYGKSNERIGQLMPFRPLRNTERWAVFRDLARKSHFPLGKKLMILALLVPGALLYEAGRRSGMLARLRGS